MTQLVSSIPNHVLKKNKFFDILFKFTSLETFPSIENSLNNMRKTLYYLSPSYFIKLYYLEIAMLKRKIKLRLKRKKKLGVFSSVDEGITFFKDLASKDKFQERGFVKLLSQCSYGQFQELLNIMSCSQKKNYHGQCENSYCSCRVIAREIAEDECIPFNTKVDFFVFYLVNHINSVFKDLALIYEYKTFYQVLVKAIEKVKKSDDFDLKLLPFIISSQEIRFALSKLDSSRLSHRMSERFIDFLHILLSDDCKKKERLNYQRLYDTLRKNGERNYIM